jgi:hypothetical protein
MHTRTRVFGFIHVATSDATVELRDRFLADPEGQLRHDRRGGAVVCLARRSDGSGKDIITKMKEAGVTTVVFSGDPLGPQYLTKIATEQDYFPEWVLGVTQFVDTTVFSRTYDQRQWAHAFGPSNLFVRMPSSVAGPGFLYRWYFGEDPPAGRTCSCSPARCR